MKVVSGMRSRCEGGVPLTRQATTQLPREHLTGRFVSDGS